MRTKSRVKKPTGPKDFLTGIRIAVVYTHCLRRLSYCLLVASLLPFLPTFRHCLSALDCGAPQGRGKGDGRIFVFPRAVDRDMWACRKLGASHRTPLARLDHVLLGNGVRGDENQGIRYRVDNLRGSHFVETGLRHRSTRTGDEMTCFSSPTSTMVAPGTMHGSSATRFRSTKPLDRKSTRL